MQAAKDWRERETRKVFENIQPERLAKERARAKRLGVKPMSVDDPGFEKVANEKNNSLKWAVTESGALLFVPHSVEGEEISHTVLTNGGPVVATGEAVVVVVNNKRFCAKITNHSGHYRPDESSLEIGKQAFRASGITLLNDDSSSGATAHQASASSDFHEQTLQYISALGAVKDIKLARKAFFEVINERVRRMEEVESAVKIARGEINSNKDHHVFDKPQHKWHLTGLDRQGNWDLIETTLLNKYEEAKNTTVDNYEVEENFGNYKVTVTGRVVKGALRISDAWVNPR